MKKLFCIVFAFVSTTLFSQVAIGKSSIDGDGLLDFESGTTKGLVLPVVTTLPSTNLVNGTIVMDHANKKIIGYENGRWRELTGIYGAGNVSSVTVNPSTESANGGVVIGSTTSAADGILVLESTNKALILPKIDRPHLNVKSPYPGMICYDTYNRAVAIFDGTQWYYWK